VFSGTASGGTRPYSFQWSFGDGGIAVTAIASHAYILPGTYVVILKVTDSKGVVARATTSAVVQGAPSP